MSEEAEVVKKAGRGRPKKQVEVVTGVQTKPIMLSTTTGWEGKSLPVVYENRTMCPFCNGTDRKIYATNNTDSPLRIIDQDGNIKDFDKSILRHNECKKCGQKYTSRIGDDE